MSTCGRRPLSINRTELSTTVEHGSTLHEAAGRKALESLGVSRYEARERADSFRRHNVRSLEALGPHYKDETRRLSMAKAALEELKKQFERDREALEHLGMAGWQSEAGADGQERAGEERAPDAA